MGIVEMPLFLAECDGCGKEYELKDLKEGIRERWFEDPEELEKFLTADNWAKDEISNKVYCPQCSKRTKD